MRIHRLTIRNQGRRRSCLVPAAFTIGTGPGERIILNHPALDGSPLRVTKGRFQEPLPPGFRLQAGGRTVEGPRGCRLQTDAVWWPHLAFLLLLLLATLGITHASSPSPVSQDWSPLALPAEGPLGFSSDDRRHPQGVRFRLPSSPTPCQLRLRLGGRGEGEVRLQLGERRIASLELPAGWGGEETLELPPSAGERVLELTIHPLLSPPLPWAVREVRCLPLAEDSAPVVQAGKGREERLRSLAVAVRAFIATGQGEKAAELITRREEEVPAPSEEERRVLRGLRNQLP